MSIEAVHWALDVPVSGNAKVVLIGVANHAGPDGRGSYPSLDTLAGYAYCDRATARRNLRKLEGEGWIERTGLGPKGQIEWRCCLEVRTRNLSPEDGPLELRECVYCGGDAELLDHVLPRSRGGGDRSNKVPACGACNQSKGASDVHEWVVRTGRDWSAIAPRLIKWGVQIEGGNLPPTSPGGVAFGVANGVAPGVAPVSPEPTTETDKQQNPSRGDLIEVFEYWRDRCHKPAAKFTDGRRRRVVARLREGYTVADVRRGIEGAAVNPPVNREDGTVYDDLVSICRNGDQLERYMARADGRERGATVHPIRAEKQERDERRLAALHRLANRDTEGGAA